MARSTTSREQRAIRFRSAEVSTGAESLSDYAETIAFLVAVMALCAAAWIAMHPSETADLPRNTTVAEQVAAEPEPHADPFVVFP